MNRLQSLLAACCLQAVAVPSFAQSSPYIDKVFDYCPAPGQFVNLLPEWVPGDDAEAMRRKAELSIAHHAQTVISLGGWGGYVTFGFDHMVENVAGGYDFKILGNAFYASGGPTDTDAKGGSAEPGIVMVSYDANGNGLPDDAWYELAGSEHQKPETRHGYACTYYRTPADHEPTPAANYAYLCDTTYIRWRDNGGATGFMSQNTFHRQSYYPQWIEADTLSFTGTRLRDNGIDESGSGHYFMLYCFDWGYADNLPNKAIDSEEEHLKHSSEFKIDWAVDGDGKPVSLPGIHFVRVYTGVSQSNGWLGEASTEVMDAWDLHLLSADGRPVEPVVRPDDEDPAIPSSPDADDDEKVITLDILASLNPDAYSLMDGRWTDTYNNDVNFISFNDGMFNFSHNVNLSGLAGEEQGALYWDGFTICDNGDNADYGADPDGGWIEHQWGCMAGGGLDADMKTQPGRPYLVAYWGYYYESMGLHSCQVDFDGEPHRVKGVYVSNHPWPYHGIDHGDGFSQPFAFEGSYFTLTAHGLLEGEETGTEVTLTLAEYADAAVGLEMSSDWQWMDLAELGEVDGLYFTMESSDATPMFGPNTAVYFCLDRLQIYETPQPSLPAPVENLKADEVGINEIAISWSAAEGAALYEIAIAETVVSQTYSTSFVVRNLDANTTYTIHVTARNEAGYGEKATIEVTTKAEEIQEPIIDPEPIDPKPVDPEPTDPEPTDPEPTDPEPVEPEPTDPEPTDPEPEEPTAIIAAGMDAGAEGPIYDLKGRRVMKTEIRRGGIYLYNNKRIMIK